jgi:hypothetical protein
MYFDDPFTLSGAGRGIVLISPNGNWLPYVIRLHFHTINNVVEYEALINGWHTIAELREDSPTPASGTLPSQGGLAPTLADPTGQAQELEMELAVLTEPPNSNTDWWKLISMYLQLGAIPDNETGTRRLARRAKGYLIHDNELYHCSTSCILQRCIPVE